MPKRKMEEMVPPSGGNQQTTDNYFIGLPDDLLSLILFHLASDRAKENEKREQNKRGEGNSLGRLALVSHRFHPITRNFHYTLKLIDFIIAVKRKEIQELLGNHPGLAAEIVPITDGAGQTFNCSPFQYALWILDMASCNLMLDSLPASSEGEAIRQKLYAQAQLVKDYGLEYEVKGKRYREKHLNFELIAAAVNLLLANHKDWSREELEHYWDNIAGQAQLLVPLHMSLTLRAGFAHDRFSSRAADAIGVGNFIASIQPLVKDYSLGLCKALDAAEKRNDKARYQELKDIAAADISALWAFEMARSKFNLPELLGRLAPQGSVKAQSAP
ncbi:TPA: hypothetical protein ACPSKB_001307 [Legionella feeleii]